MSDTTNQPPTELLLGFVPLAAAAAQPNMPSLRTLQRMAQRRELAGLTYFGKKPFLNVDTFRAAMKAREVKVLGRHK